MRIRASAAALLLAAFPLACSSSSSSTQSSSPDPAAAGAPGAPAPPKAKSRKDPSLGVRVLDAVVVERSQAPSGSDTARGYSGTGNYYMVFETHEGDATARYTLEVNRTQWFRFQEGARVRITLNNNILQDIRSLD
jgi:hypothetical protein